ncbi:MAG: S66 family peptidase [Thermomicrobiales bacterium]
MIKPAVLKRGDTIGIVSPSSFGGEAFIPRAERGITELRRLGFRVKVGDHAFNNHGYVSDTAEHRVSDLHAMFADPDIKMMLCTLGGDHACHLLPLLDWDLIRANPKIFMGFSDITVLNVAFWAMTGMVTFSGPSLLTDWAEFPEMPAFARDSAMRAIASTEPIGDFAASPTWTDEFLDWSTGADLTRPRIQIPANGWRWLRGGTASGTLIGGCIESLQHLRGTRYWPDLDGAILFLETSDEKPLPKTVDALLMDFENMGVFGQIGGIVLARPYGYDDADRNLLHEIVIERTETFGFSVLADVDCGR